MLTRDGPLRIVSGRHKASYSRPAVPGCTCHTCRTHSLAYLHHLVKAKEPLAATLLTLHNIHFMCELMVELRQRILKDEI